MFSPSLRPKIYLRIVAKPMLESQYPDYTETVFCCVGVILVETLLGGGGRQNICSTQSRVLSQLHGTVHATNAVPSQRIVQ